jgi:Ca2+-transporting ATPase
MQSPVVEGKELDEMHEDFLRERLKTVSIFARVSPEHKVKILEALQHSGEIVAMGGDGVNDAPALKKAHVGFAMGRKGTDVARETAQIVLTDDHFATIVEAIEEGRTIYDNIRKFVVFLLRANFDELLVVFTTILLGFPLPLLPIHLLLINLVTDSLPAIALALEKPEPNVMRRPPRDPRAHILHGERFFIVLAAIIAAAATFQVFFWGWKLHADIDLARTLALTTAILFELFLVMTCRSRRSLLRIGFFSNPYLLGAVAIGFTALLAFLYTPLASILHVVPLTPSQWMLPLSWSLGAFLFFEAYKIVREMRGRT